MALGGILRGSLRSTMPLFRAWNYAGSQNLGRWILYTCFQKRTLCGLPAKMANFSGMLKANPAGALLRPPLPFSRALILTPAPSKEIERSRQRTGAMAPAAGPCPPWLVSHAPACPKAGRALAGGSPMPGVRAAAQRGFSPEYVQSSPNSRADSINPFGANISARCPPDYKGAWGCCLSDQRKKEFFAFVAASSGVPAWLQQLFGVGRNQPKELPHIPPQLLTLPAPRESAQKKTLLPRTLAARQFQPKKGFALCPIH